MPLYVKDSKRVIQQNPNGRPNGSLSNTLPRETGACSFEVTSETTRARIVDDDASFVLADHEGRLVTIYNTGPYASSSGNNIHDRMTFIVSDVPSSSTLELRGYRAEYELPSSSTASVTANGNGTMTISGLTGQGAPAVGGFVRVVGAAEATNNGLHEIISVSNATTISVSNASELGGGADGNNGSISVENLARYVIHAAIDFTAPNANFQSDRVLDQGITFPELSTTLPSGWEHLSRYSYTISGYNSATSVRISDPHDNLSTFGDPPVSTLEWQHRDPMAVTYLDLFWKFHNFFLQTGWVVYQLRGRNSIKWGGADRHLTNDIIYFSDGEDGLKRIYIRMTAGSADENSSTTTRSGIDLALFSVWERDFDNSSGDAAVNQGHGINPTGFRETSSNWPNNTWALAIGGTNADITDRAPLLSPFLVPFTTGVSIADAPDLQTNAFGTIEGGDLYFLNYTFVGDKDEVNLQVEAESSGGVVLHTLGQLAPRPEQTRAFWTTNFSINKWTTGDMRLRVGGEATLSPDIKQNGENPVSPTIGLPLQVGDNIQISGQYINKVGDPGISTGVQYDTPYGHEGEFIESKTISAFPGLVNAIGYIQFDDPSNINDGDTFQISDGVSTVTFEYDKLANGVTGGNVAIDISAATDAGDVSDAAATAIDGSSLDVSAASDTANAVTFIENEGNVAPAGAGNVLIIDTSGTFVDFEGMNGGGYAIDVGAAYTNKYEAGALVGEDAQPLFLYRPRFSASSGTNPFNANTNGFNLSNSPNLGTPLYLDAPAQTVDAGGRSVPYTAAAVVATGQNEQNPNAATNRFLASQIFAVGSSPGALRGSPRYVRTVSNVLAPNTVRRDRNGFYHYIVRFTDVVSPSNYDTFYSQVALGPIPASKAFS